MNGRQGQSNAVRCVGSQPRGLGPTCGRSARSRQHRLDGRPSRHGGGAGGLAHAQQKASCGPEHCARAARFRPMSTVRPGSPMQAGADVVELLEVAVLDAQIAALAGAALDLDLEPQRIRQVLLEGVRVGVLVARRAASDSAAPRRRSLACTSASTSRTLRSCATICRRQRFGIVASDQRAGVAGGQLAFLDQRAAPAPAASAGAACWRDGCGSCRSPRPAAPACSRSCSISSCSRSPPRSR